MKFVDTWPREQVSMETLVPRPCRMMESRSCCHIRFGCLLPIQLVPTVRCCCYCLLSVAKRGSLGINALSACFYVYIRQLSLFYCGLSIWLSLLTTIQHKFQSLCNFLQFIQFVCINTERASDHLTLTWAIPPTPSSPHPSSGWETIWFN